MASSAAMKKKLEQIMKERGDAATTSTVATALMNDVMKKKRKGGENIISQMSSRLPGRNPHYSLRFPPSKYNSKGPANVTFSTKQRRGVPRR
jgi:hypothetical protein